MKSEADLLQLLRDGSVDTAVAVLERIHDARQAQARLDARGATRPLLGSLPPGASLGNALFTSASAQAQILASMLTQQSGAARGVRDAIAQALGIPRPGPLNATQVVTWRARATDTAPARRRFVVRNQGADGVVAVGLGAFVRPEDPDVLVGPHASLRVDGAPLERLPDLGAEARWGGSSPLAAGTPGFVPRGGTALVEVELAMGLLLAECQTGRYTARMSVSLQRGDRARELQSMVLELVVHA